MTDTTTSNQEPREPLSSPATKKQVYETPTLTVHGPLRKLTQASGGSNTDGLGGSQSL
jgi:hypothetical protein